MCSMTFTFIPFIFIFAREAGENNIPTYTDGQTGPPKGGLAL